MKDEDLVKEIEDMIDKIKNGNVFLINVQLIKMVELLLQRFSDNINKKQN